MLEGGDEKAGCVAHLASDAARCVGHAWQCSVPRPGLMNETLISTVTTRPSPSHDSKAVRLIVVSSSVDMRPPCADPERLSRCGASVTSALADSAAASV